jgi:hypothetical protein
MRRIFLGGVIGVASGALLALSFDAFSDAPLRVDEGDPLGNPPREGWPPDPQPVASTKQWVFEIRSKDSVPSIVKVSEITVDKPTATARVMGRFALEFYVGTELLDRVRFDVPLAGDVPRDEDQQPGKKRPQWKVNTKLFARMADHPRATLCRLVDRATGDIQVFLWPPDKEGKLTARGAASVASSSASASAPDGGKADAGADGGKPDAGKPDAGKPDAGKADAGKHKPLEP